MVTVSLENGWSSMFLKINIRYNPNKVVGTEKLEKLLGKVNQSIQNISFFVLVVRY